MELTPAQTKLVESKARFRTLRAGRRFGKTYLAAMEMVARASASKTRQIYFAPTYGEAYDIMWHELQSLAEPVISKKHETRMEVWIKNMEGTESYIRLSGWDLKVADRVRGQKYHHIYVDEVAKMQKFDFYWKNAALPTLLDYNGGATFLSTPRGFNHFYDLCTREGDQWEHFHFTSYDNPHLPEGAVELLLSELGEDSESQEILAEFTQQQGLVYHEFKKDIHIKAEIPFSPHKTIAGIDFGYTDPAAVYSIRTDGFNYYIETEYYETGRTHQEIADYTAVQGFNEIYADPAAPEAIEVMRKKSLPVKEVKKGKDSIMAGVLYVKQLLRANRIYIHPRCKKLIRELDMYVFNENKADNPVDEYNHACDAIRYAIWMQSGQNHTHDYRNLLMKSKNRQNPKSFV